MTTSGKIFISHASTDKELLDEIVDLIQVGVGVTHNRFFCASLEGLGIPEGEDFKSFIHSKLQNPPLVIMVITPGYYESAFCLCELGATWVMSHSSFPLIVPPVDFRDLRAVLNNNQAGMIDNPSSLDALRDRIIERLEIGDPVSTARWNVKRDEFLKRFPILQSKMQGYTKVSVDKYAELRASYKAAQDVLAERKAEIERLRAMIEKLKNLKNREAVASLVAAEVGELECFEELKKTAVSCMEGLPAVVIEALYYRFYGEDYSPSGDETYVWDNIRRAAENGYLDISGATVSVNTADQKIRAALANLTELAEFLVDEDTSAEFHEQFETDHGFPAEIKNRRFWEGVLGL